MPLIDPELLPFVDEVRAENAATAARMKESLSTFDPKGDLVAQMRAMMEPGGVFGQPLVDAPRSARFPGPRATSRSASSCRRPWMRSTSPFTAARS